VPIQLAQCRLPGLAISTARILIYFSNKIYRSNFVNQHSETVRNRQVVGRTDTADCCIFPANTVGRNLLSKFGYSASLNDQQICIAVTSDN